MVNVGKYTIHRSYVLWVILATCEYGKKSLKMIFEVIGSMGSSWHWNRYNMWIQNTMLMYIFDINVDALNNIGCFLSFNRSPLFLNSDTLGGKTQFEGLSSWTLSNSLGETSKSIQKKITESLDSKQIQIGVFPPYIPSRYSGYLILDSHGYTKPQKIIRVFKGVLSQKLTNIPSQK